MELVWLGLICSIEFDWFGSRTHTKFSIRQNSVFDLVRLPNSIELNLQIEFDWVRLSSISERSIDYAWLIAECVLGTSTAKLSLAPVEANLMRQSAIAYI